MLTENVLLALRWGVGLNESVTVTTMLAGPATVGVPVMAPLLESMDSPTGRPVAVQV
jgi:hypothetical protein